MDINKNLSYLLGAYLGDGCSYINTKNHVYQFSITSSDIDLCLICQKLCKKLFNKLGIVKTITKNKKTSYYQLVICSKFICEYFREHTYNKTLIPLDIKNQSLQVAFVQGIMDSDGWISKVKASDGYIRFRVGFKNTAEWTYQFQRIISNLGVSTGQVKKRINFRYTIRNKDNYTFTINSKEYCNKIGFRIKRKQLLAKECLEHYGNVPRIINLVKD